jgi:hypothetical protein
MLKILAAMAPNLAVLSSANDVRGAPVLYITGFGEPSPELMHFAVLQTSIPDEANRLAP